MYHYTYLLIHLEPKDERMFYIGVRSSKVAPDKDPYMGSSKSMTKEEKSNCDKLILEEFSTRAEALAHEIFLHNKFDVATNPKFFNNAKQTSTGFDTTGKTFTFTESHIENMKKAVNNRVLNKPETFPKGWNHTEEAKRKIAESKKDVPRSPEVVEKLKNAWKIKLQQGYVSPSLGSVHTEETRKRISEIRKASGASKGVKNPKFKPWFIIYPDGTKEVFNDITKEEKAIQDGFISHTYLTLFTSSRGVKPIKKGKFKGYIVGNVVDDIVCST